MRATVFWLFCKCQTSIERHYNYKFASVPHVYLCIRLPLASNLLHFRDIFSYQISPGLHCNNDFMGLIICT